MFNINSNVLQEAGYTADQLAAATKAIRGDNKFTDFQAFINAESKYGINSVFILAHAAVESAWGTSYYAQTRNNLLGFNAIDSNPNDASSYPSQGAAIDFYANFLKQNYLTPSGAYYNGTTIHGVFVKYSSSHDTEANTVAGIMNLIVSHIYGNPQPPAPQAPAAAPGGQYHIQSGDTFWGLEVKWGIPHGTLQALNPGAVATDLQIGQAINVPGGGHSAGNKYTIKSGDTFWGLEAAHGWPHGVLQGLNPGTVPTDLQIGQQINTP